jgi:hypothetical protein
MRMSTAPIAYSASPPKKAAFVAGANQGRVTFGLEVGDDRWVTVGVHDHDSPAPIAQIDLNLMGTGPLSRADPEVLLAGRGWLGRAGRLAVSRSEGVERDLNQFRVGDVGQVFRHIRLGGDADEDLLAGDGGCPDGDLARAGPSSGEPGPVIASRFSSLRA